MAQKGQDAHMTTRRNFLGSGTADRLRLRRPGARPLLLGAGPGTDRRARAHQPGKRDLARDMPVEGRSPEPAKANTYLEAAGRLPAGIAPRLELPVDGGSEGRLRARYRSLARQCLDTATDRSSPGYLSFGAGKQSVVDAAFLAQALLRAPTQLWKELAPFVRARLAEEFTASRKFRVMYSNKLLFSAIIEAELCQAGAAWNPMRVDYAVCTFGLVFHKGDGAYGGPGYRWDCRTEIHGVDSGG